MSIKSNVPRLVEEDKLLTELNKCLSKKKKKNSLSNEYEKCLVPTNK